MKILPYKDGGFGLALPEISGSSQGILEMVGIEYQKAGTKMIPLPNKSKQYNSDDFVKFSYHHDGFVQFSSLKSKIISGRNADGSPKGLGVKSWPLNNPILTGASVALSFWGTDKFPEPKGSDIDAGAVFDAETIGRHTHISPSEHTGQGIAYGLSIYVIPIGFGGSVVEINGKKNAYLSLKHSPFDGYEGLRLREQVRVIELPDVSYRLCISIFEIPGDFGTDTGYILIGPTDGKNALLATYPQEASDARGITQTMTYSPELESEKPPVR